MAHSMVEVIGGDVCAEIDRLAGRTANASGELRNFVIHGQPFIFDTGKHRMEIWARFSARKGGVKGRMVRWTAAYIDRQTGTVRALIANWEVARAKAFKQLDLWRRLPSDLREDATD